MGSATHRRLHREMAENTSRDIGREVRLARAALGLTRRAAARVAGVSPTTQDRVERGDPMVGIDTACRVANAVGLKLWVRAFPIGTPSLRDTGQLRIAQLLSAVAHTSYHVTMELPLGDLRSADLVFYGPTEILHVEIERVIADLQDQYRRASDKREMLAGRHSRPVRLVFAVEDTRRNREALRPHSVLVTKMCPAGSRVVMQALKTGRPLERDGLLWVRPGTIANA
jgi:transcriptional regulator with XRE-family HTH domain